MPFDRDLISRLKMEFTTSGADAVIAQVNQLADAERRLTAESAGAERAALSIENKFKRLENTYAAGVKQARELERVQRDVNIALAQNPALQERANAVLAGARERFTAASNAQKSLADSTKLTRYEMINLSRQVQDVFVGLASGQAPTTVAIQQFTQIADIFAASQGSVKGFFTQLVDGALSFITPGRAVVAGVLTMGTAAIAAAANFRTAQQEINQALIAIGRQSGVTSADVQRIAESQATPTGLSTAEARSATLEFIKTGRIGREMLSGLAEDARKASKILGIDLPAANKLFAESFADPGKGVDELGNRLGGVTAKMREDIKSLAAQLRFPEAQQALREALLPTLQRSNEVTSTWSKTWTYLGNAISNVFDDMGKGLDRLAGNNPLAEQIQQTRAALDSLSSQRIDAERAAPRGNVLGLRGGNQAADEIKRLDDAIAATQTKLLGLEEQFRKTGAAAKDADFTKRGNDLATLANAVAPGVQQLQRMRDALAALDKGLRDPDALATMSEAQVRAAREGAEALRSQVQFIDEAQQRYRGLTGETAVQVRLLNDQVRAAQAIGTSDRLVAQQEALINQYRAQGKSLLDAQALAAKQIQLVRAQEVAATREAAAVARDQLSIAQARGAAAKIEAQLEAEIAAARRQFAGNAEAIANAEEAALDRREAAYEQINESAEQQLRSLQQQSQLINAVGDEEQARIQYNITLNNLIDQGVDSMLAAQIASQQLKNNLDQAANAAARMEERMDEARQAAAGTFLGGGGSGSQFRSATGATPVGGALGPNTGTTGSGTFAVGPDARTGRLLQQQIDEAKARGAEAEFKVTGDWKAPFFQVIVKETSESIRNAINATIRDSGNLGTAIDRLLSQGGFGGGDLGMDLRYDALQDLLRRQTEMSGDPAKEVEILKQQIEKVKREPFSLEQLDLLKSLGDRLKELTDSTNSLNNTMKIGLDPIYTQGHDALKIGYYSEGGGGRITGTDWAKLPDGATPVNPAQFPTSVPSMPLPAPLGAPIMRFASGGYVDRPTVALIGEAGPEIVVPMRLPVVMPPSVPMAGPSQSAGNDNAPMRFPVIVNQNFPRGSLYGDRRTRRLGAQGYGRAIAAASN